MLACLHACFLRTGSLFKEPSLLGAEVLRVVGPSLGRSGKLWETLSSVASFKEKIWLMWMKNKKESLNTKQGRKRKISSCYEKVQK